MIVDPIDAEPSAEDIAEFKKKLDLYRYDYVRLAYLIFRFGEPGTEMEHIEPYDWQVEEWQRLSLHMANPVTRFNTYFLIVSSGNGAAKTAWCAMTNIMLMYTHRYRGRITANTDPQMKSVVWPEYEIWFRRARYSNFFFNKFGTSIKAKNERLAEIWRLDTVNWSEESPTAISGLHNKGGVAAYTFEEAPGIPANIWKYASGAFTETDTIKVFFAVGNSDDPESYFEQCMESPLWNSRRIDTRTLDHIDKNTIERWLQECGGNEDHDDFRVRVRGLPRKASKDAIIGLENVIAAIRRCHGFDVKTVSMLPTILTCDPAWQGGDETVIWVRRGNYAKMLARFKLNKEVGETHMKTYLLLCQFEKEWGADAVFIDQGEGTAIYTLAMNAGKMWELISFASSPYDSMDFTTSEYANLRAQMYHEANKWLMAGGVLDAENEEDFEDMRKQFSWTKGTRHKANGKKLAEAKLDIKKRVGKSPDIADGFVLTFARPVTEKISAYGSAGSDAIGQDSFKMPDHADPYENMDDVNYH